MNFSNALRLLIATILSAQCTDKKVNEVTKILFKRYRSLEDYANADLEELQKIIKPTGFYRNKAKFIKAVANALIADFNSDISRLIEELIKLLGVARKTANIVISNAFGINEGIAVDMHVMRLSKRLGFAKETDRNKIEMDLMKLFPKKQWFEVTNLLIAHGRNIYSKKAKMCRMCCEPPSSISLTFN